MVARFGAAEEAMLPPANGWLQHADAAASGNPWAIWVGVGAAKPANGWGQGVAAGGGGADELDPNVSAAGGVDAGGRGVGGVDPLTCQRLGLDCSLVGK